MRNGVLSFSAVRDITANGTEDTHPAAACSDAGQRGRGGSLAGGGDLRRDRSDRHLRDFLCQPEIRPGTRFILSFDRSGGITDDDENVIRTRLAASLTHNLTEASSLVLGANLSQIEEAGLAGMDTARVDLSLAYRYALTRRLDARGAAPRGGFVFEDGSEEDRTTTLSIGIERRFSFRP
jgi:hypothetical protein